MKIWFKQLHMAFICLFWVSHAAIASELFVPSLNSEDWLSAPRTISTTPTYVDEEDFEMPEEPILAEVPMLQDETNDTPLSLSSENDLLSQLGNVPSEAPSLEGQELIEELRKLPKDQRDAIEGFVDSDLFFVVEFADQDALSQKQQQAADAIAASLVDGRQTIMITVPSAADQAIEQQIQNWINYLKNKASSATIITQEADEKQRPILQDRRIFVTIKE